MSTDNREDYLINILRLTDGVRVVKTTEIANYMGVAPASVTEMLKILSKEGLVNYERYRGVSLTAEGITVAKNLRRKHHIMERFLTDVLDVDHQSAHDNACAFEHSMSEDAAIKICHMIGHKVDGDCDTCPEPCDEKMGVKKPAICLVDAEPGDWGTISHVSNKDVAVVRKLISMGFVPGRAIKLDSKVSMDGARIILIGDSVIALDKELCSSIFMNQN